MEKSPDISTHQLVCNNEEPRVPPTMLRTVPGLPTRAIALPEKPAVAASGTPV